MTKSQVIELMESSRSDEDWNENCLAVKQEFDGYYPDFWYDAILTSGVYERTVRNYGGNPDVEVRDGEGNLITSIPPPSAEA